MESEFEEWKETWRPEYLSAVCAFANYEGGTLIIGKRDNGEIIGVSNPKKLLEEIPNSIRNVFRFSPKVRELTEDGKTLIVVTVEPQRRAVDYEGVFYTRSGATTVRLIGDQLIDFLQEKGSILWADLHDRNVKIDDLSKDAIDIFVKAGLKSKRMSPEAAHSDRETLLKNYDLMDDEGLKRSAAILFLQRTKRSSYSPDVKIGAFDKDDRLLRDDWIDGPVISKPDRIMNILLEKYIQGTYDVEGLRRVTKYPYPEKAIREAIMNATAHRDYSRSTETSIKVYPDRLEIFNPGRLPRGWTSENLLKKHSSEPANESIARVFYDMEYIEKWGSGIGLMRSECKAMGIPEPEYNVTADGIEVIFRLPEKKDADAPKIVVADLKGTESKVYALISEGKITTALEMSKVLGISDKTVKRTAAKLVERGYIERVGGNKTGKWVPLSNRNSIKE